VIDKIYVFYAKKFVVDMGEGRGMEERRLEAHVGVS
jgi:hypothetical protein